jgi:hypothetical protein
MKWKTMREGNIWSDANKEKQKSKSSMADSRTWARPALPDRRDVLLYAPILLDLM